MDKLKEKLNALRTEADSANQRADASEQQLKYAEAALAVKGMNRMKEIYDDNNRFLT